MDLYIGEFLYLTVQKLILFSLTNFTACYCELLRVSYLTPLPHISRHYYTMSISGHCVV
jgi:hypothetical protein